MVVTGMGALCPLGFSVDELWNNLLAGQTSIRDVTDTYDFLLDYYVKIGSLFDAEQLKRIDDLLCAELNIKSNHLARLDLFSKFAMGASIEAIKDAGIWGTTDEELLDNTGVCIGTGVGGLRAIEEGSHRAMQKGLALVSPLLISRIIPDAAAGNVAMMPKYWKKGLGFHATESPAVSSACASGASGIRLGYMNIRCGYADMMIVGGSEESGTELGYGSFGSMRALSRNKDPNLASRPFDKERDGFVLGEGAGMVILEEHDHAVQRGADIYAELVGIGATTDSWDMTKPRPDAKYVTLAMTQAMRRAGITPEHVSYINAHGTSTPYNDASETKAIKQAFGNHALNLHINSTKSMIGHTLGAAGGLEMIVTTKSIQEGKVHITRGYHPDPENPDPDCDLNYTADGAVEMDIEYALSNSFGFFGHNVTLLLKRYSR